MPSAPVLGVVANGASQKDIEKFGFSTHSGRSWRSGLIRLMSIRYAQFTSGIGGMHPAVRKSPRSRSPAARIRRADSACDRAGHHRRVPRIRTLSLVFGGILGAAGVVALLLSTRYEVTLTVLVLYLGLLDGPVKLEVRSTAASGLRDILIISIVLGMRHAAGRREKSA